MKGPSDILQMIQHESDALFVGSKGRQGKPQDIVEVELDNDQILAQ